jgi:hypothetical protein
MDIPKTSQIPKLRFWEYRKIRAENLTPDLVEFGAKSAVSVEQWTLSTIY